MLRESGAAGISAMWYVLPFFFAMLILVAFTDVESPSSNFQQSLVFSVLFALSGIASIILVELLRFLSGLRNLTHRVWRVFTVARNRKEREFQPLFVVGGYDEEKADEAAVLWTLFTTAAAVYLIPISSALINQNRTIGVVVSYIANSPYIGVISEMFVSIFVPISLSQAEKFNIVPGPETSAELLVVMFIPTLFMTLATRNLIYYQNYFHQEQYHDARWFPPNFSALVTVLFGLGTLVFWAFIAWFFYSGW